MRAKKSLKISKGLLESVNRRTTNNTMAKRKRTNTYLRIIAHKTKDRVTRTPLTSGGELRFSGRVSSSTEQLCSNELSDNRHISKTKSSTVHMKWQNNRTRMATTQTY